MSTDSSVRKKIPFSICIFVICGCLVWGVATIWRTCNLYCYAKEDSRGWSNPAHCADPELGWRPIPGVRSAHTFSIGPSIPMGFDEDGFRAPLSGRERIRARPIVLALGCSVTYGDACVAEDTFPFKTAGALGGTEINAGVCSYGLAQMLILAERLIPEYHPDYVLIQYSPWLVSRARRHFAPTYYSTWPNPFFADAENGKVVLRPPVFLLHDVDISPWKGTKGGPLDFISFFGRAALPLYVHDDMSILFYSARLTLGLIDKPSADQAGIIETAFGRIISLCLEHGAEPIIVVVGMGPGLVDIPSQLPEKYVVNAQMALVSSLSDRGKEAFSKAYHHYRGTPPIMVDGHPNPRAHTMIAESILEHISSLHPEGVSEDLSAQQSSAGDVPKAAHEE